MTSKDDFGMFFCDRKLLDNISNLTQRRVLIYNYCNSKFNYYNLVYLFYTDLKGNGIVIFIFLICLIPLCIYWMSHLSKKYLTNSIQGLINKTKFSPTLSSLFIISYSLTILDKNSYNSEGNTEEGMINVVGFIFGSIIFNLSLTLAHVIKKSKDIIIIPKKIFFKELGFILFSVSFLMFCGYFNFGGYKLSAILFGIYISYVGVSFFLGKKYLQHIDARMTLVQSDFGNFEISDDEEFNMEEDNDNDSNIDDSFDDIVENKNEEKDNLKNKNDKKNKLDVIIDSKDKKVVKGLKEIFYDFFLVNSVEFLSSISICASSNKKMDTHLRYIVIFLSYIHIFFLVTRLTGDDLIIFGMVINIIFLITIIVAELSLISSLKYYILEFCALLATLNFISITFGVLLDMTIFLSFYFNIDKIIVYSILIASEHFLINFFTLGELSKQGNSLVAALSVYSSQITSLLIPFSLFIFLRSFYYGSKFKIFEKKSENIYYFFGQYFLIIMFFAIVVLIVITTSFVMLKRGVMDKLFSNLLIGFFSVFAGASILFTFITESLE